MNFLVVGEDGYLCFTNGAQLRQDPANVKKRHRRIKSSGLKTGETEGTYLYIIIYNIYIKTK